MRSRPLYSGQGLLEADPYDNQVGEIETKQRGLLYEEFERSKVTLLCEELTDKEENR